jgi:hypothetical protein
MPRWGSIQLISRGNDRRVRLIDREGLVQEQGAVLYVLLTLATCGLLIVSAISKLESRDAEMKTAAIRAKGMSTSSLALSTGKRLAA